MDPVQVLLLQISFTEEKKQYLLEFYCGYLLPCYLDLLFGYSKQSSMISLALADSLLPFRIISIFRTNTGPQIE